MSTLVDCMAMHDCYTSQAAVQLKWSSALDLRSVGLSLSVLVAQGAVIVPQHNRRNVLGILYGAKCQIYEYMYCFWPQGPKSSILLLQNMINGWKYEINCAYVVYHLSNEWLIAATVQWRYGRFMYSNTTKTRKWWGGRLWMQKNDLFMSAKNVIEQQLTQQRLWRRLLWLSCG